MCARVKGINFRFILDKYLIIQISYVFTIVPS